MSEMPPPKATLENGLSWLLGSLLKTAARSDGAALSCTPAAEFCGGWLLEVSADWPKSVKVAARNARDSDRALVFTSGTPSWIQVPGKSGPFAAQTREAESPPSICGISQSGSALSRGHEQHPYHRQLQARTLEQLAS
jgi:hypothetical protein